jgi:hypothetical protein
VGFCQAYSTRGPGSDKCDTFRKLFATLLLLCPLDDPLRPPPTILLTYTPRRAPEAAFFELLSTAFVWTAHPAPSLLPAHEGQVDERIWVYHLHRSNLAGRHRAVKQQAYIHQAAYASDLQVRKREAELSQRMKERAAPPAANTNGVAQARSETIISSSGSSSADVRAPSLPQHITPTFARYLDSEEQRQQRTLEIKLASLRNKHAAAPAAANPTG